MRKILILLAHPELNRSEIHAPLLPMLAAHEAVSLVDLYAEYPNFYIDIRKEQRRLQAHDVVLFQYPLYWFSTPSILKEWQDAVLEYGFAYGEGGDQLHGKAFGQVLSMGTKSEDFQPESGRTSSLEKILLPQRSMAELCGMHALPHLALYDAGSAHEEGRFEAFKLAYLNLIDALADEDVAYREFVKREDFVSLIRKFMGV